MYGNVNKTYLLVEVEYMGLGCLILLCWMREKKLGRISLLSLDSSAHLQLPTSLLWWPPPTTDLKVYILVIEVTPDSVATFAESFYEGDGTVGSFWLTQKSFSIHKAQTRWVVLLVDMLIGMGVCIHPNNGLAYQTHIWCWFSIGSGKKYMHRLGPIVLPYGSVIVRLIVYAISP